VAIDWGQLHRDAERHGDLLTRQQCLEAGLSDAAMQWRVSSRRWVRLHPGVFLTKPGHQDWEVAATVLDVARDGSAADALSVVARAVQKDLVTVAELRQELGRRPGHRYGGVLRPALGDVEDGGQSGAELLYIRDVERAHGLPAATRQSPSDRGRRRFHDHEYEEWGLIVEVDGRLGHEQWSDRVRDGQRDRQLLRDSRMTTRVFWVDVAVQPCATAIDVAAILRGRGWTGAARPCRRRSCPVPGRAEPGLRRV
jgi:hypothetical protein